MILFVKSKPMILIISIMVSLSVMVVATYAYFQADEEHGIIITTDEYQVEMFVYFGENLVSINSPYYNRDTGIVTVNADDETSENYVGDLNIYISVLPIVASRFRFEIEQEWVLRREYLNQGEEITIPPVYESLSFQKKSESYYPFSNLKLNTSMTYLYDTDGYVYYDGIVAKSENVQLYHIISGGDAYPVRSNSAIDETCNLYFDFNFEIVQANRFSEVWGIDSNFFN